MESNVIRTEATMTACNRYREGRELKQAKNDKMAQCQYLLSLLNVKYIDWDNVSINGSPVHLELRLDMRKTPEFTQPLQEDTETTDTEKAIMNIYYSDEVTIVFDKCTNGDFWTAPIKIVTDTFGDIYTIGILELLNYLEINGDTEARKNYNRFICGVTSKLLGFTQGLISALQVQEFRRS